MLLSYFSNFQEFFSIQTMKTRELLMSRMTIMSISSCDYFINQCVKGKNYNTWTYAVCWVSLMSFNYISLIIYCIQCFKFKCSNRKTHKKAAFYVWTKVNKTLLKIYEIFFFYLKGKQKTFWLQQSYFWNWMSFWRSAKQSIWDFLIYIKQ
jgi:hypothetical protein